MKAINIGFVGTGWMRMSENFEKYSILTKAIDDGNETVYYYTYNTILAIRDGDFNSAQTQAFLAFQAAKNGTHENHKVECIFCNGTGSLDITYRPNSNPDTTKDTTVNCIVCDGTGMVDAGEFLSDYAPESRPENVVAAVLSKDIRYATEISNSILKEIDEYLPQVKQDSFDRD